MWAFGVKFPDIDDIYEKQPSVVDGYHYLKRGKPGASAVPARCRELDYSS